MTISRLKKLAYSQQFHGKPTIDGWKTCHLYLGSNSWQAKEDISTDSVILPAGDNPADYDWSIMRGNIIFASVLGNCDLTYRKRVALYALRGGAYQIRFKIKQEIELCGYPLEIFNYDERYDA
ncbi:hypothetical protein [Chromatium okenii]|jgi:hypothetical protein|uniref:hypothetical protein n=1 Tax=Chromatium okenii TaxID=61644 RepID=UPI0026E94090|nr:hypothetical protein [Chromatium okenii]MBV5309291.1 hypothetical protein [Chromatium okenii]